MDRLSGHCEETKHLGRQNFTKGNFLKCIFKHTPLATKRHHTFTGNSQALCGVSGTFAY